MSAGYRFRILDVFTTRPYAGSPLAVLPEAQGLSDEQMQKIASEFAFSATAFVRPPRSPGSTHRVRIFTPAREIPFAGHATIGSALTLLSGKYGIDVWIDLKGDVNEVTLNLIYIRQIGSEIGDPVIIVIIYQ